MLFGCTCTCKFKCTICTLKPSLENSLCCRYLFCKLVNRKIISISGELIFMVSHLVAYYAVVMQVGLYWIVITRYM